MPKSKFSKKDLAQVKQDYKKEKITQSTEENISVLSKNEQLKIARNVSRDLSDNHKVTVSYGFEPGNLVHFKYKNKEEIGLIFKINKSNNASHASEAMSLDEVEILSSAGYIKVQAKSIYEIIECNWA